MTNHAIELELPIRCFLTEYTAEDAVSIIHKNISIEKLKPIEASEWFIITVNFRGLREAIHAAKNIPVKCGVITDDSYGIDDWSIKYNAVNKEHRSIFIKVSSVGPF